MKLFTRFFLVLALVGATLAPSIAADIVILVGNNFYRGPNNTTNDFDIQTITAGDKVTWNWVGGSHPTASDNGLFQLFQMNASNPTNSITFNTPGVYPYHCTSHGAPNIGQYGRITVIARTPTATLNAREAGISVNVFPNPSRGQVTVKLDQKLTNSDYQLRLSNIIGQEIRRVALKPEAFTSGLPVDLSDLRAGMYFYTLLVDGKAIATKRLVLQN